jgi:hypothetical protein
MTTLSWFENLHTILHEAGAQVPTAIAAPLTVAAIPSAIDTGFNVAASIMTGNYVGAASQGIPLIISAIVAGYGVFSQPKGPTNESITNYVNTLSRDDLIELLNHDSPTVSKPTVAGNLPIAKR